MDPQTLAVLKSIVELLATVFCVTFGCGVAAFAQSRVISNVTDAMARQPELANDLRFSMIIGLAMIESLAIYCLLISLIMLFSNN